MTATLAPPPRRVRTVTGICLVLVAALLTLLFDGAPARATTPSGGATVAAVLSTADKSTGPDDGWAQLSTGGKVWVSASCRSSLASSGVSVRTLEWSAISAVPDVAPVACDQLHPNFNGVTAVLSTADKSTGPDDGWAQLSTGGKVWVSASCRSSLASSGVSVRTLEWSAISAVPDVAPPACDQLHTEVIPLGAMSGPAILLLTADKQAPGNDGWIRLSDGTMQWISAECRTGLQTQGIPTIVAPWAEINALPPANPQPCSAINVQPTPSTVMATGTLTRRRVAP